MTSKNIKPIHKFNGGKGATLCHNCSVIITEGLTDNLYCMKCLPEIVSGRLIDVLIESNKNLQDVSNPLTT